MAKDEVVSLARNSWLPFYSIWVKFRPVIKCGEVLYADTLKVRSHFGGIVTVEKCHYYPNLWSGNTMEYYCDRKFVIVQHKWSVSGLRFRNGTFL